MRCPVCGSFGYDGEYCSDCGYSMDPTDYIGFEHGDRD